MGYSLSTKAKLTESLERITASEVDAVLGAGEADASLAERVHETRKTIKRLRALLRLYREALPRSAYEREDATLRKLAKALGGARDEVALGECFDRLLDAAPADSRARLAARAPALRAALVDADESPREVARALGRVHEGLGAVRARAEHWKLDRTGSAAITSGLRRTYARGRRTLARARRRTTEKRLHALRTRVKRHQYQLALLEPLWPEPVKAFRHEAQRVGELLGHDHDLSLLERRLHRLKHRDDLAPLEPVLRRLAESSHAALRREALELASRLYAESPSCFAARYREYFDAWP